MTKQNLGYGLVFSGAAAALVISIAFVYLKGENRNLAETHNERQLVIDEGIRLSRFNSEFVKLLAQISVQSGDEAFKDLLARHGITYTFTPATKTEETGDQENVE